MTRILDYSILLVTGLALVSCVETPSEEGQEAQHLGSAAEFPVHAFDDDDDSDEDSDEDDDEDSDEGSDEDDDEDSDEGSDEDDDEDSGKSSGSSAPSTPPAQPPAPAAGGGPAVSGEGGVVRSTIVVARGATFDGKGKRYMAGSELGDGSQSEGQKPLFRLEHGARLLNVVLGAPAADGIHTYGDATLENIVWEDIGEDALTIKESGNVVLNGGSAQKGEDKVFQINAASSFRVSNFKASGAGKFIRQNGGTNFKVDVFIDRCDISNMKEAIFRTDSKSSTVTMTNTRYSKIGKELFMGVSPANVRQQGNTQY